MKKFGSKSFALEINYQNKKDLKSATECISFKKGLEVKKTNSKLVVVAVVEIIKRD